MAETTWATWDPKRPVAPITATRVGMGKSYKSDGRAGLGKTEEELF